MQNLYKLSEDLIQLSDKIEQDNGNVSEDDAEAFIHVYEDFESNVINMAYYIRSEEARAEYLKKESERINKSSKAILNKIDRLKEYIKSNMEINDITTIKGDTLKVSIRKSSSPKLNVIDESVIAPKYFRLPEIEPKLDKNLVKEDLKKGITVDGVSLKESNYLYFS